MMPLEVSALFIFGAAGMVGIELILLLIDDFLAGKLKQQKSKGQVAKKKEEKRQEKVAELKDAVKPVPFESPIIPLPGSQVNPLEEYQIPDKIPIELTKIKGGKRIVVVKGNASIRPGKFGSKNIFFFIWGTMAYFIKPNLIIELQQKKGKLQKLVFDILYSEPLNQDGTLTWDDELELIVVDSAMDQYIVATTMDSGFNFTTALRNAIIIIAVLGSFLGLATNGVFHFTPTTLIHWLPRA